MRKRSLLFIASLILLLAAPVYAGTDANPGDIVINEIMQNPAAVDDTKGEWIEIYNNTGSAIDINGWTLKDDGSDSHVIANGGPLTIPAGGYLVLCRNSDSAVNGGVSCDYQYSGFLLANSSDEVELIDDGSTPQTIDRVVYDNGATFPDPNGKSMSYGGVANGSTDPATDNDSGNRWGESTSTYGSGDYGTPGAKNDDVLAANAVTFSGISAFQGPSNTVIILSLLGFSILLFGGFWLRRRTPHS
jgi:hypothetical protein